LTPPAEELAEERQKASRGLGMASPFSSNPLTGLGALATSNVLSADSGGFTGFLREYAADQVARADVVKRAKLELTDPIAFLKTHYPNERPFRFILTHPDLDHMRGLKSLYEHVGFTNFWDTLHTKPTPHYRSDADKEDWEFYCSLREKRLEITPKNYTRGASLYAFGKEEDGRPGGDNIEILSPTPTLVGACDTSKMSNDLSLVLRVHHAGKSVLPPGDAEALAWDGMQEAYGERLKSDFLKASHHGRDTGYHLECLKFIEPLMTFVSVGRKPDTDASNKYRKQTGRRVASTRYHGNIELRTHDDGTWEWFVDENAG
jgi:competence protein ComEC